MPNPQETPAASGRYYIPALDGLRLFAFLLVFFHHAAPTLLPGDDWPMDWQVAWHSVVMAGAYGVPVFFALSGYLITTLLQREQAAFGKIDVPAFYARRALRIWPLYFLILILDGVLYPVWRGQTIDWSTVGLFGVFLANFKMLTRDAIPMPLLILWSVCIEEQFYLVWPWLNFRLSPISLRLCAWFMVLAAVGFRTGAALAGWWWSAAWFHTLGHLDAIGFGALAALELHRVKLKPLERNLVIALGFAAPVILGWWAPISGVEGPIGLLPALAFTGLAATSAGMVWAIATSTKPLIGLSSVVAVRLGRISYGLYAYHTLVIACLFPILATAPWQLKMVATLAATILVAALSFAIFEKRFLTRKLRFQKISSGMDAPAQPEPAQIEMAPPELTQP